jgi:hypothetical protein
MIYESPDGGKTIYSRQEGELSRKLIKQDSGVALRNQWYLWYDIIKAAENSHTLANAIKQAETIYALIKEEKT